MPQFEQIRRRAPKRSESHEMSTFPETMPARQAHGGNGDPDIDKLLARIDEALEAVHRGLGRATGIESV